MRTQATHTRNTVKWSVLIGALALLLLAAVLAGCASGTNSNATANTTSTADTNASERASGTANTTASGAASTSGAEPNSAQEIKAGEFLTIPVAAVSSTATFYPVVIDGTTMEVLAVTAPDGTIRTAFNTCEVCYDSGRGYYEQEGDVLVCQNCGNRFKTSEVEVQSNGCNPWPIFAEDKTVTDEAITLSYDFLSESTRVFANWKRS
ncbi:MAG: DUF2318 domain-containing protein [Coriobacteriales bacterium]|jgi:hypothetical protein|nr:DUF2318 domain-containing protein [Coriobacteriales bacterium]